MRKLSLLSLTFAIFIIVSACGEDHSSNRLEFEDFSEGLPVNLQFREDVAFLDLDGDGLMDMITPAPRPFYASPKVFLNKGDHWIEISALCSFPPQVNFYGWVEVDRDGNLFFAIHGRGLFALKRTGYCSWEDASSGLPPSQNYTSRALAAGDINRDGFIDIAAISDDFYATPASIRVFLGDGRFYWTEASNGLPDKISGDHISLSDINKDGNLDIIVDNTNQSINSIVWLGDGHGNWTDGSGNLPKGMYFAVTPYGNGFFSMVFSDTIEGGPFLFILEDNSWKLVTDTGLPNSWYISAIAVADLDRDGIADLVLGDNSTMTLRVFKGLGNYKFRESVTLPLPLNQGYIWNIRISDINMDGKPDIAVNLSSSDNLGTIRVFVQK
jgi:hypothetical protein